MKLAIKNVLLYALVGVLVSTAAFAQEKATEDSKAAYKQVVTERAQKIVVKMNLRDDKKAIKVRDIIAQQYIDLNEIHDAWNAAVKNVKELNKDNKAKADSSVKLLDDAANAKLAKLRKQYISKLNKHLSTDEVDMVKDGMTYGVLPITYKGYQEMLPNLIEEQKNQILVYLTEARELAMDAGSSEKKHAWFGKYKGKINNYLSAAGIDMNKASKEWQQRIKEQAAKGKDK